MSHSTLNDEYVRFVIHFSYQILIGLSRIRRMMNELLCLVLFSVSVFCSGLFGLNTTKRDMLYDNSKHNLLSASKTIIQQIQATNYICSLC